MADDKAGPFGEVEGDYGTVKVQLAGGNKEDKPKRPTKGTQVVWGGTDPSSPWGHLQALIEKAGGSVTYTYVHAADLKEPLVEVTDEEEKKDDGGGADDKKADAKKDDGKPAGDKKDVPPPHPGGQEGSGPLFDRGIEIDFNGNKARIWAHPHCFQSGPRPLIIALHGINGKSHKLYPALDDKGTHVGKLVAKLIDDNKVTPLVIAAPTHFSDAPWGTSTSRSSSTR